MAENSLFKAKEIMEEFARQTGLLSDKPQRRYLWTDAFAVCNFIELYRQTGEAEFKNLALNLVDQVHYILGRHRGDDERKGWISGLGEEEGRKHPTIGGLRIGKELSERKPNESFDEVLEWGRDGQYYHYLTKWMHALNRVCKTTGDRIYNLWAMELAKTAHASFVYSTPSGVKRMYWKMSIDLSRPLVQAMGQHDPLDGLITYVDLQSTASKDADWPDLGSEIKDMAGMCEEIDWATSDPLGIGELLCNAYKAAQLIPNKYFDPIFVNDLLESSETSLEAYILGDELELPANLRLAFRELGLSIGLKSLERLKGLVQQKPDLFGERSRSLVNSLLQYVFLAGKIEKFWLKNRGSGSWREHLDINMVMLATSMAPDGYLKL
ncbi:MAG: hypothetical protein FGF50_00995 [Candidatus Brockarchaeota archaeon]|nr:hypothetical protein [Candidatus Brockarchaeota archaeon]